jgi:hypothetical protein
MIARGQALRRGAAGALAMAGRWSYSPALAARRRASLRPGAWRLPLALGPEADIWVGLQHVCFECGQVHRQRYHQTA